MTKVVEFIMRNNNQLMLNLLKQSQCRHDWSEHGKGYLCTRCDYTTGDNEILNDLIKQAIDERKKK